MKNFNVMGNQCEAEYLIDNCKSCNHYGFCLTLWGTECKRQGGHRIPRLKTTSVRASKKRLGKKHLCEKTKLPNGKAQQKINTFESIKTRKVSWL